ncbi:toxin YoeB [Hymenobacter luteus]|uniref:Putative mRNA interferase YoeB n=2 Tax=Hymenobacter TaxID=89966 RepID=A0A7W9WC83_9BACT|nr:MULTISPECIES: Txe/YoeB family addiction module toxin [Hymenobacter]MBB4602703.1 toxin YoeB [Hymenobacter latericoloratus]MBB6060594.1 toxin YoeB [Hymenobacter luteus]
MFCFSFKAWEQYQYWHSQDPTLYAKITALLEECRRTPHKGTGKPEPLKGDLRGWWSRRINHEHRLVYKVEGGNVYVAQCRYHYAK